MAKKGAKSAQRLEYEHELYLAKRRIKSWQKKHRMLYTKLPKRGNKSYAEAAEQLREIKWTNLTEKEIKKAQRAFDIAYEQNEIPIKEEIKKPYTPHTETEFMDNNDTIDNTMWEETPNQAVDTRAEIDASIENIIDTILDVGNLNGQYNAEVRDMLEGLLRQLRRDIGDEAFYEFMSDPTIVTELKNTAYEGMTTSPPRKGKTVFQKKSISGAVEHFAFVLNNKQPLDTQQAYGLGEMLESAGAYGEISFDAENFYED